MPDLEYTLGINPGSTSKVLDGIKAQLLGLGAVAFGGSLLSRGFQFNQTMYDGEKAIQAIVQQFQFLNAEAAKPVAAKAMQQLVDLEPKVAGSLADIVNGFVSTAAASAGVGLTVDQNIDLVGRFANALAKLNMPIDQVGQELRSILTGNIGADSQLAKTLGITNEMADAAKKAGTLYGLLRDKLGLLGEAGDNAATAFSSFKSAVDKAAGALASGLFETAISNSGSLSGEIDKNKEAFQDLGSAIGMVAREVIKFASFVNEAAKEAAYWVAVATEMVSTGRGFDEITAEMEAISNAQRHAAETAREQAAAEKEAGHAAADANAMRAKSAAEAAAATAKAGLTQDPEKAAKAKKKKEKEDDTSFDPDKAAKVFDDIIDKQGQLDELKRASAMDEMTTAQKVAAVRAQIAEEEARAAALQSDFVRDEVKILDSSLKQVQLQRELGSLQREQNREAEDAAKKAQDKAEQQRKAREQMAGARNDLMGELAILKEQADGHDKKAKAIQRELDIEKEKQAIIAKTGASEADALRMAKEKAGYEDRIAKRKERNSNRDEQQGAHIGGVTRRTMMGGSSEGAFADLQKSTSRFDALQKQPFGAGALAPNGDSTRTDPMGRASRGGVDSTSRQMSKLMGQTNTTPLSGRIAAATTNAPPKPPGPAKVEQDPAVGKLDQILSELTRIRTT